MNGAVDLSLFSMGMTALLLIIPLAVIWRFKLGLNRSMLISVIRMAVQLVLIGFFLEFLFKYNNWLLNLTWFLVMISVAAYSVSDSSSLSFRRLALPLIAAFVVANLLIVLYFNAFIVQLDQILDAKYVIAIGGMILGNSLRSNVVGLGDFYQSIRREENAYFYQLALGATLYEALLPFARRSFRAAINPTIATMATMGIVSLPGMMTGQILGGSVPMVAIKYQIAIMVAILASAVLSIALGIIFTSRTAFDKYGVVRKEMFLTQNKRNK